MPLSLSDKEICLKIHKSKKLRRQKSKQEVKRDIKAGKVVLLTESFCTVPKMKKLGSDVALDDVNGELEIVYHLSICIFCCILCPQDSSNYPTCHQSSLLYSLSSIFCLFSLPNCK